MELATETLDADWVIRGLRRLRDTNADVFGASVHRFKLDPTLHDDELCAFEERYRIRLPADYRAFLANIGNGGAGPYYGVFPLGSWDGGPGSGHEPWVEGEDPMGSLSAPFLLDAPWNDREGMPPAELADSAPGEYERRLDEFEERYWDSSRMNGALPICHEGCGYRVWLVVTGAQAGRLWSDGRVSDQGLVPLLQEDGSATTFTSWYRAWLEEALSALPERPSWSGRLRRLWRR